MNYQFQETEERAQRIAYLISGYVQKTLTTREHDELDAWVEESDDNMELFANLTDERNINEAMAFMKSVDRESAYQKIRSQIFSTKRSNRWLWPVSIAALLLVAVGVDWFMKSKTIEAVPTRPTVAGTTTDKQAGGSKAVLQLADGKKIELDGASKGEVAKEGSTAITANNETITYSGNSRESTTEAYNTLIVPRGGKYKLLLADGSQVCLNAASFIRYPVAFTGNERKVEIEGEAFFDIVKDDARPFIVQANNATVQVLGTSFNINAYSDESAEATTLVSGMVKVITGKQVQILSPGQQASVHPTGHLIIEQANLQEATAWKDDNFVFKDEPIENIMRQLARWYSVDVSYKGNINWHFNASISRTAPLSKILGLLQATQHVHFTISADHIEVRP